MPKTVSSSEAQSRFGELLKWSRETNDAVIVKLYGEPAVVMVPYQEYQEGERLRRREQKRLALEALDTLRREARRQAPDLTAEDAYRTAGFSVEAIAESLEEGTEPPALRP